MNVTIQINCDDERELLTHLSVIRTQVKKAFKKDADADLIQLEDNNCYGDHEVVINQ